MQSVKEYAQQKGISVQAVRKKCKDGNKIKAVKVGNSWIILEPKEEKK